ncbi:hypothetical protein SFRURICE_011801 [Spodoptera frugiperda]|nr:hypothetical protein SFRURICE_011801 [Spodoptera frugiperda]
MMPAFSGRDRLQYPHHIFLPPPISHLPFTLEALECLTEESRLSLCASRSSLMYSFSTAARPPPLLSSTHDSGTDEKYSARHRHVYTVDCATSLHLRSLLMIHDEESLCDSKLVELFSINLHYLTNGVSYSFFYIRSYTLEQAPGFIDRQTDGQLNLTFQNCTARKGRSASEQNQTCACGVQKAIRPIQIRQV